MLLGGLLDEGEEGTFLLLSVDDECATEYLVTAMLGVNLCETEYLGVGERTSVLLLHVVEILYLLWRQGKSLLLVELLQIVYKLDGLRSMADGEDRLVEAIVHSLEHGVMVSIL